MPPAGPPPAPSSPSSPTRSATLPALAALLTLALVAYAVSNRFLQDDAYISFRYAKNLVEHGELNWNPGERPQVEGYTNFLWVLLMAGAMRLGQDPAVASQVLGLVLGAGTLLLTFVLARRVLGCGRQALLTLLLLGTHFSFSAYMTGGLETPLQGFLLVASVALVARIVARTDATAPARPLAALSVLLGLSFLTRMDSALLGVLLLAHTLLALGRRLPGLRFLARAALWLTLPGALLAAAWLAWKLHTYGDILPNTWYLKASERSQATLRDGASYLWQYLQAYALPPFLCLIAWNLRVSWREPTLRLCVLLVASWWAYVVGVGGDFMEFRFCMPVAPFLMLLLTRALDPLRPAAVRIVLAAGLVGTSLLHGMTFQGGAFVESVGSLQAHLTAPSQQWVRVGEVLGELFGEASGGPSGVLLATLPSGAIPYVSELPTIDMLGLSDPWVARHGNPLGLGPGHSRVASLDYLLRRGVNLLVAHPQIRTPVPRSMPVAPAPLWSKLPPHLLPPGTVALHIPLDPEHVIEVLYLTPHAAIDEIVEREDLRVIQVRP